MVYVEAKRLSFFKNFLIEVAEKAPPTCEKNARRMRHKAPSNGVAIIRARFFSSLILRNNSMKENFPMLSRRFALSAAALAIALSFSLTGCSCLSEKDAVVSAYEAQGFVRRDLDKVAEDIRIHCEKNVKCTPEIAARDIKDLRAIAADEKNPVRPFVLFETLTTDSVYKKDGKWTDERSELHDKSIKALLSRATKASDRGERPLLCLTGGGSASGKSLCVEGFLKDAEEKSKATGKPVRLAVIDSDAIKKDFPEYTQLVHFQIKSAADQVHGESSILAKAAFDAALQGGYDTLYDGTLKSPAFAMQLFEKAREHNANIFVRGIFVDPKVAISRVESRLAKTGRAVPCKIVISSHQGFSRTFPMLIAELDFKKGDHAELYSSSPLPGKAPVLIYKDGKVLDSTLWQKFLEIKDKDLMDYCPVSPNKQ